jgi:hypothetical protein
MKKILSILTMSLIIVSCTSDDINPDQYFAGGSKIVGFTKAFETVSYFADEGQVTLDFPVSLIGSGNGQTLSEDIEITYQIDAASSTATEGVEFEFANTSGKLMIPAGSSFVGFPLKINTGQLNPTMKTELVVKLTAATNNTVVGQQYESLKIIFVGCQSLIAGDYTVSVKRADVATPYVFTGETITTTSVNNFITRTSGHYAFGVLQGTTQGYNFVDICGEITVPQQQLAGIYSNLLQAVESNDGLDGEVIDANSFYTRYEIGFTGNTVWRQYRSTYTRI